MTCVILIFHFRFFVNIWKAIRYDFRPKCSLSYRMAIIHSSTFVHDSPFYHGFAIDFYIRMNFVESFVMMVEYNMMNIVEIVASRAMLFYAMDVRRVIISDVPISRRCPMVNGYALFVNYIR